MVSSDQAKTFAHKFVANETSSLAPSLMTHNGNLLIAWQGINKLNVAQVSLNGILPSAFSHNLSLANNSYKSPSLASLNGSVYLASNNANNQLTIRVSNDNANSFVQLYTSTVTSANAASLAINNGYLFIIWLDQQAKINVSVVGLTNSGSVTGFTTPDYLYEVEITSVPVHAGDKIQCTINYKADKSAGEVIFNNISTGKNFQITLLPPPGAAMAGNSAEWILEAPGIDAQLAHLPKFTPLQFSQALATGVNGQSEITSGAVFVIDNDASQPLTQTTLAADSVTIIYL